MKPSTPLLALWAGAALTLPATFVSAQTLTALNPTTPTTINSVSVGTNGVIGYDFFATRTLNGGSASQADLTSFPSFASVVGGPQRAGSATYSTITIDGTTYQSGVTYQTTYSTTLVNIATINLTGTVPVSFTLGFLLDNTDDPSSNSSLLQASLNGSTPVAINTTDPGASDVNNFFFLTVTGASAGDSIAVTSSSVNSVNAILGGVTFSEQVPEPSTYAAMLAGLGALVLARRFFRRKA